MDTLIHVIQVIIALGIFNVWLVRSGRATKWRGGDATTMREEFEVYGLPGWVMGLVGFLKLLLAALLVFGIWIPGVTRPAALGLALLMLGAMAMHMKVKDPLVRSLPAFTMFVLSAVVALA